MPPALHPFPTRRSSDLSAISAGRSRLALESPLRLGALAPRIAASGPECSCRESHTSFRPRSEEHTSELQSLRHLVCRLLLEKKKSFSLARLCYPTQTAR